DRENLYHPTHGLNEDGPSHLHAHFNTSMHYPAPHPPGLLQSLWHHPTSTSSLVSALSSHSHSPSLSHVQHNPQPHHHSGVDSHHDQNHLPSLPFLDAQTIIDSLYQ